MHIDVAVHADVKGLRERKLYQYLRDFGMSQSQDRPPPDVMRVAEAAKKDCPQPIERMVDDAVFAYGRGDDKQPQILVIATLAVPEAEAKKCLASIEATSESGKDPKAASSLRDGIMIFGTAKEVAAAMSGGPTHPVTERLALSEGQLLAIEGKGEQLQKVHADLTAAPRALSLHVVATMKDVSEAQKLEAGAAFLAMIATKDASLKVTRSENTLDATMTLNGDDVQQTELTRTFLAKARPGSGMGQASAGDDTGPIGPGPMPKASDVPQDDSSPAAPPPKHHKPAKPKRGGKPAGKR